MAKSKKDLQSVDTQSASLSERRVRAVEMRVAGEKLATISETVNLSQPTIISAYKAFLNGGWDSVNQRARGRSIGSGSLGQDEADLCQQMLGLTPEQAAEDASLWTAALLQNWLQSAQQIKVTRKTALRYANKWGMSAALERMPPIAKQKTATDLAQFRVAISRVENRVLIAGDDLRGQVFWFSKDEKLTETLMLDFLSRLHRHAGKAFHISVAGIDLQRQAALLSWMQQHDCSFEQHSLHREQTNNDARVPVDDGSKQEASPAPTLNKESNTSNTYQENKRTSVETQQMHLVENSSVKIPATNHMTHLDSLEAESIHIIREVVAETDNPVMLFSFGKDSAVMHHLAKKAFFPASLPFPLLHIDTTWKFRAMYEFKEKFAADNDIELLTYVNEAGLEQEVNPITHGSELHTSIMKTTALKEALDKYGFDAALGGARRDEERSRSKERIFSFRNDKHNWDPKNQRPELWKQFNTRMKKGESMRVFPLSNWTELDVWQYIHRENIPVVPLYLADERPVVERDGMLVMVDDSRLPLAPGEVPTLCQIRFRTLGCYPLTGAIESTAVTIPQIIEEQLHSRQSERSGRMIDHESTAAMEKKKMEGYF